MDSLTPIIGSWNDPYFETLIGLGFSGSCFEGLTVVSHLTQSLSALIGLNGDRPQPCKDGIVHLIAKITEAYFAAHSGDGEPILRIIAFGFDDARPWVGNISWDAKNKLSSSVEWADGSTLVCVGETALFQQYANDWRGRIQKHRDGLRPAGGGMAVDDAFFEYELAVSQHDIADKKTVEEEMLRQIESECVSGIGGVLQRLELGVVDGRVVAGFTQDDRTYLDGASYTVAQNKILSPIPIVEKMGRQIRKPLPMKSQ